MIGVKLRLVTKPEVIERKILDAARDTLREAFQKSAPQIKKTAIFMVREAIRECPEYRSIVEGRLRGELGIVNSEERMIQLLDIWGKSVNVSYTDIRRRSGQLTGRIRLTAINADFEDVLSTDIGRYETEKGQTIPWLEWMLKYGDQVIIRDYYIRKNPLFSRTGTVVMYEKEGASWSVPAQYSGTITDNFVTRATDSILSDLGDVIINQLNRQI